MFKKPPSHISPSTPLRSSDRRKLLTAILTQYGLEVSVDDVKGNDGGWKGLVPDGIRSGKVRTSAEIQGVIYSSDQGDPVWMTLGRDSVEYIPTLYTTPLLPIPFLPLYHSPPPPFLAGAPLFIPAILHLSQPYLLPDLAENALCYYVASHPSEPSKGKILGVGRVVAKGGLRGARERWERAKRVDKGDGKGLGVEEVGRVCETLNMVGDSLWEMGSKSDLDWIDIPAPTNPISAAPPPRTAQEDDFPPMSSTTTAVPISEPQEPTAQLQALAIADSPTESPVSGSPSLNPLSTSEIDSLLSTSLHQALLSSPPLPIPASSLYSQYILPNRPASIAQLHRAEVVVAKSSWKKVGKWMKSCEKEGVLGGKERSGEYVVTTINLNHDLLATHRTHKFIAKEEMQLAASAAAAGPSATGNGDAAVAKGPGGGDELLVEEFWRPSSAGVPFWEGCGFEKSSYLSHSQILSCINDYVTKNSLTTPSDRALIALNPALLLATGLLKVSKQSTATATSSPGGLTLRREPLLLALKSQMSAYHRIGGDGAEMRKGEIKPVTMAVKTRQGRKTVTIIIGVEAWGLGAEGVGEDLKRICAGSATVNPLTGAAQKLGLHEIMVQGSQTKAVTDYLMGKGVPRKWIKEEGAGSGKGKK